SLVPAYDPDDAAVPSVPLPGLCLPKLKCSQRDANGFARSGWRQVAAQVDEHSHSRGCCFQKAPEEFVTKELTQLHRWMPAPCCHTAFHSQSDYASNERGSQAKFLHVGSSGQDGRWSRRLSSKPSVAGTLTSTP